MKQWTTLLVFLFLSLSLSAQQEYGRDIFVSSKGDSLPYRMIHPESVKPGEKYPLVLFLHGAGERGNDNEKQLTHGGQMFLNPVNQEKYPAFHPNGNRNGSFCRPRPIQKRNQKRKKQGNMTRRMPLGQSCTRRSVLKCSDSHCGRCESCHKHCDCDCGCMCMR